MLLGAVGCNIAWGLIDAIIFLMTSLTERARGIATRRALRQATDTSEARAIITETSPPLVAGTMDENDFEAIRRNLGGMSEPPPRPRLGKADFLAAVGIFFLVFLATFPVVIPFLFMRDPRAALRISNAIALVMFFLPVFRWGTMPSIAP